MRSEEKKPVEGRGRDDGERRRVKDEESDQSDQSPIDR